ncbi:hypothetical protein NQ317_000072 [Molorchus minor]|uniref:Post-GPI attachment to proteins factor 3 n=1 Tax=Molorchus minor TaxID=1323400 RepID=A0ABQ9J095_9CUCU|nr:hypothetical protein NQ317_000072 [Molorchus minor]
MHFFLEYFILVNLINYCMSSIGDNSRYYKICLERCILLDCENFLSDSNRQQLILYLTQWSCRDDCSYECMWKTVDFFQERHSITPQFHGKWPFYRFLGLQEPASVFFSLLNAYVHLMMIRKFRKEVRSDSPLYWLWHAFFIVCLHAWFWSAVFHARDFPLTELLDYTCAFSIVLMSCYVMAIRVLRDILPGFALIIITFLFTVFFAKHVSYLSTGRIDYGYNMKLNIFVGAVIAICWIIWCLYNYKKQPYVWNCAKFVILTAIVTLLEVIDQPPIYYVFDSHSIWHLSTAPLAIFLYRFAIDDCKFLKKQEIKEDSKKLP